MATVIKLLRTFHKIPRLEIACALPNCSSPSSFFFDWYSKMLRSLVELKGRLSVIRIILLNVSHEPGGQQKLKELLKSLVKYLCFKLHEPTQPSLIFLCNSWSFEIMVEVQRRSKSMTLYWSIALLGSFLYSAFAFGETIHHNMLLAASWCKCVLL